MTNQDFKNKEFETMQEAWSAYKKFYCGSSADDDSFWTELVCTMSTINEKYKTDFARQLTELFICDIEKRSINGKTKENSGQRMDGDYPNRDLHG